LHKILASTPWLKFTRGRVPVQRRVDFNQGVDARILCKDTGYLRDLATISIKPLRIAFDHWGLRPHYERAVRYAHEHGLREMSNYMLYNFHDTPRDLFQRMRLNVELNEDLGLRIWSFPMRYQPTDLPDRSHIGEHWTRYQLRSLQIILQATHGVVSGDPEFYKRAFGDSFEDFAALLLRPYHFIFNRDYYDHGDGSAELHEYERAMQKLSSSERDELLSLVSSCDAREFRSLAKVASTPTLRRVLRYYVPLGKAEEATIWDRNRAASAAYDSSTDVPDDERVEDAGLHSEEETPKRPRKEAVLA
jgi:hypothetical protein